MPQLLPLPLPWRTLSAAEARELTADDSPPRAGIALIGARLAEKPARD